MPTNEERKLELIGELFCKQYNTIAKCYIEPAGTLGPRAGPKGRSLIVQYGDNRPEFAAGIPDDWTEADVMRLLLSPIPLSPYPVWEIPARAYGNPTLFGSPGLLDPKNDEAKH